MVKFAFFIIQKKKKKKKKTLIFHFFDAVKLSNSITSATS